MRAAGQSSIGGKNSSGPRCKVTISNLILSTQHRQWPSRVEQVAKSQQLVDRTPLHQLLSRAREERGVYLDFLPVSSSVLVAVTLRLESADVFALLQFTQRCHLTPASSLNSYRLCFCECLGSLNGAFSFWRQENELSSLLFEEGKRKLKNYWNACFVAWMRIASHS